jgi:two-component system KDP operon response regulator KdpE
MRSTRILIVDDEPAISRALRPALMGHEFEVATAASGAEGLALLESFIPDIILLDLSLPDIDGIDLTPQIREQTTAPIIVLSVRGADRDKISALDRGADDYLTKPFSMGELLARIRVALRHRQQQETLSANTLSGPTKVGDLIVDAERHLVTLKGRPVRLSRTEFNLLEMLARNAGRVIAHRTLLHNVWGPEYTAETQLLRVYISQIRGKIEERPERPTYILTEPGIGYRFRDDVDR